jgi:hypothetical protein
MTFANRKSISLFIILIICSLFSIISYPSGHEPIPMEPDQRIRQSVSEEPKLDFRVDPTPIGEDGFSKLPTWGNDVIIATGPVSGGISADYDTAGNLYAARCSTWSDKGVHSQVVVYKSTNSGASWFKLCQYGPFAITMSYPVILTGSEGNRLYVFELSSQFNGEIFVARFNAQTGAFETSQGVALGATDTISYFTACTNMGRGDTLVVVYQKDRTSNTPYLYSTISTDFGQNWSPRVLVTDDGKHPDIAYGQDGYLYLVYQATGQEDICFKRGQTSGGWGFFEWLTTDLTSYRDDFPKVAALHTTPADNATVWVVYNHTEAPDKSGNTELRFAYSTNSGVDWTKDQILDNSTLTGPTEFSELQNCKSQPCETTPDTLWGGIIPYYYWVNPSFYGDLYQNERFDMPLTHGGRLDQIQIVFYGGGSAGTPDPDLYVWLSDGVYPLDNNPPAGAIADFHIRYGDIIWYPSYTVVETWEQGVEFGPGESFHIGFGHAYADGDTLAGLSDDGSSSSNRSTEWWGDHWGTMLDEWGAGVDFSINTVICPFSPCDTSLDTLWGGTSAAYYWKQPSLDRFTNMRFDMPADHGGRLEKIEVMFYKPAEVTWGTPDPDLYVWSSDGLHPLDDNPPAGAIADFHIDYDSIVWFPSYTLVETWKQGIEFGPGEAFHIGFSHAFAPGDTLAPLSDDGSMGTNRSSGWSGSVWEDYWPYEFLINAVICPSEPVPPLYDEMAADLKVYRSPSHTYVDLCYLRSAAIRQPILDVCYTWASSSSPDQFHAPHQKINDNLSNWSPDGREVCQLTYSNLSEYPGIVYAGLALKSDGVGANSGWNLWFDYHPLTDVEEDVAEEELPVQFSLSANFPNPFNPVTRIQYTIGRKQTNPVTLRVYNVLGQLVRTLVNEPKETGTYEAIWEGKDDNGNEVASGVYFYKLQADDFTQTRRMVLLK